MQTLKPRPFPGAVWIMDARTAPAPVPVPVPPVVTPPPPPPPPAPVPSPSHTGTITFTSTTAFDEQRNFQQDARSGTPAGYLPFDNDGWAYVPIKLKASAPAKALFIATYDATDPAADRAKPGTGRVFQPSVAVPDVTNVTTAEATYQVPVQSRLAWNFLDVSANADMSDAIRIPIKFGVGTVFAVPMTASLGTIFNSSYAYTPGSAPAVEKFVPDIDQFCTLYMPYQLNGRTAKANTWEQVGGTGPYDTPFPADLFRLLRKGGIKHNISLIGATYQGGTTTNFQVNDPRPDHTYGIARDAISHADFKVRGYLVYTAYNDANAQVGRMLHARKIGSVLDDLRGKNPIKDAFAITCTSTLMESSDGSSHYGYYLDGQRDVENSRPNTCQIDTYDAGGQGVYGHGSMVDRYRQARPWARYILGAMGVIPLDRGPEIVGATRDGDTITFTFSKPVRKYTWNQGNTGTATGYTEPDPAKAPDSALAFLLSVYPAGMTAKSVAKLPIASMQLVDPLHLKVTLAPDPKRQPSSAYDAYWARDFGNATGDITILVGDAPDGLVSYGMPLRRTLDPVYVPAPNPAPVLLTLDVEPVVSPGSWVVPRFTGNGPTLRNAGGKLFSTLEASTDDKTFASVSAEIQNGNSGYVIVPVPPTAQPGTQLPISVRAPGTTAVLARAVVAVKTARDKFPDPDGVGLPGDVQALWEVHERGTLWADKAKTRLADLGNTVMCHADALGDARNDLVADRSADMAGPLLLARKVSWSNAIADHRFESLYLQYGYDAAADGLPQRLVNRGGPAVAGMGDDATILFVGELPAAGWIFALGHSGNQNQTDCFAMQSTNGANVARFNAANQWAAAAGKVVNATDYVVASWDSVARVLTATTRSGSGTMANASIAPSTNFDTLVVGGHFAGLFGSFKFQAMALIKGKRSPSEHAALIAMAQARYLWGA